MSEVMNKIPSSAVPSTELTVTDGQFYDENGDAVPYVADDGDVFATTTATRIVAGETMVVAVAASGLVIGDFVVVGSDLPRQIIGVSGKTVTVGSPFGVNATGTTTVTRWKKVTPKLTWDLEGLPFGQLRYGKLPGQPHGPNYLMASIGVRTNVDFAHGMLIASLMVNTKTKRYATRTRRWEGSPVPQKKGGPCVADKGGIFVIEAAFAISAMEPGVSCWVRSHATATFTSSCYRRAGTFAIGPRLSPEFFIPPS